MGDREKRLSSVFFNVYCSMVEFLNDLRLPPIAGVILVCFQTLCMLLQQASNIPHSVQLVEVAEYVGVLRFIYQDQSSQLQVLSSFIQAVAAAYSLARLIISVIVLALLLQTPVISAAILVYSHCHRDALDSTAALQRNLAMRFYRAFAMMFQYLVVPVCTPLCAMIVRDEPKSVGASLCMASLVLIPLTYYLIEYHQLELEPHLPGQEQCQLTRRNFPNNLLDGLVVFTYGVAVVYVPIDYCIVVGVLLLLARLVLSYCMPFYEGMLKRLHTFLQGAGIILLVSLQICRLQQEILVFVVTAMALIVGLYQIVFRTSNAEYWRVADVIPSKLEECKHILLVEQTFGYVFRELLFVQRQSSTYRELLLVQALKKRCIKLECASRGGAKIINPECLLRYERKMLVVITNFFLISDQSISILKFMQQREPKSEIFIEEISTTVDLIAQTKQHLNEMLKVNRSPSTIELATLLSKGVLNDEDYYKTVMDMGREQIESLVQKKERKKLFNQHSGVIFLSLLEDVGKITKVSKNIKQVLSYTPGDLVGLSINELMPFSIRPFHNEVLVNFLRKYSKKLFKVDPSIKFLAYNKQFHLQEVVINYYFNMNDFENFQISGLFRQVCSNKSVILCDSCGNLEGWTADIGKALRFDLYSQADCRMYNMLVMLPALIKYQPTEDQKTFFVETLLFVPKDMKNPNLRMTEALNKKSLNESLMLEKQLAAFERMINAGQFIEVKMVQLEMQFISFIEGKVRFRKIDVKRVERIRNSSELLDLLRNKEGSYASEMSSVKSKEQAAVCNSLNNSMVQSFDSTKLASRVAQFVPDFVFGDKAGVAPLFGPNDLELAGLTDLKNTRGNQLLADSPALGEPSSRENTEESLGNDTVELGSAKNKPSSNFNPSLHGSQLHKVFYPLTLLFFVLVLYDAVSIQSFSSNVTKQCASIRNINSAFMIFVKSSFNPNLTYVREFQEGALLEPPHASHYDIEYRIGSQKLNISSSYLFNTQIPSMLARLALDGNFSEIDDNFYNAVSYYDHEIEDDHEEWLAELQVLRTNSQIRYAFIVVESAVYVLYLVYCYHHSKSLNKIVEAFFKFEKVDLDFKTEHLRECMADLQLKCEQCFLSQELPTIMKNHQLSNVHLTRTVDGGGERQSIGDNKIAFDVTGEREQKIVKRKLVVLVVFIVVFAITQIAFLILYGLMSRDLIQVYEQVPLDIDLASKLIVQPNLKIASIAREVPRDVLDKYSQLIPPLLAKPLQSVPDLFPLLQTTPCAQCSFLYPLLSTNFISFYSSFNELVKQAAAARISNLPVPFNLTELYGALDIVTGKVRGAYRIHQEPTLLPTLSLYLVSLGVFLMAGYSSQKSMERARERLQNFLKFFNEETIMKNKHLSNTVKLSI